MEHTMQINFDYYTTSTDNAMAVTKIASTLNLTNFQIRVVTDYNDKPAGWNVYGGIDHTNMGPLFDAFTALGFTEQLD